MASKGTVKPNEIGRDFHHLLGGLPDIEPARSLRLALCFHEKAMAAARNRERSGGEARPAPFGLTVPDCRLPWSVRSRTYGDEIIVPATGTDCTPETVPW